MQKPWQVLLSLLFMITYSAAACADFSYPVLVLDAADTNTLPAYFRTMATPLPSNTTVSTQGLSKLPAMGSAQFSEKQLLAVINQFHPSTLMIFDLRQEDHGFLNGNAISWYGINNQANLGKTPQQIEQTQFEYLSNLQNMTNIVIQNITQKAADGRILMATPLSMAPKTVYAESDLTRAYNFGYTRIYVTDHKKPTPAQVDHFVSTIQALPAPTWVYFHCRGGQGRTTTFLTLLDMMHNAKTVSVNDIIARQALLGGVDLSQLPPKDDVNYQDAADRLQFLKDFYDYAKAGNFKMTWTNWTQNQTQAAAIKAATEKNTPAKPLPQASLPNTASEEATAPTPTQKPAETATTTATTPPAPAATATTPRTPNATPLATPALPNISAPAQVTLPTAD